MRCHRILWIKRVKASHFTHSDIENLMTELKRRRSRWSHCSPRKRYTKPRESKKVIKMKKKCEKLSKQMKNVEKHRQRLNLHTVYLQHTMAKHEKRQNQKRIRRLEKEYEKHLLSCIKVKQKVNFIRSKIKMLKHAELVQHVQSLQGECAYCKKNTRLSKEHVIPRSVGGTLIIRVCFQCNHAKSDKGNFQPFLKWKQTHPDQWEEAIVMSSNWHATHQWLDKWNLHQSNIEQARILTAIAVSLHE